MDVRKIQLPREIHTGAGLIEETGNYMQKFEA